MQISHFFVRPLFTAARPLLLVTVLLILQLGSTLRAQTEYKIETLVEGLDHPWSIAFLSNDDYLITELGGTLRRVKSGVLVEAAISGVPEVYFSGQGGLMDVVLDQNFKDNQRIYLTLSFGDSADNATQLLSATLTENTLSNVTAIFTASPLKSTAHHYSGRLAQMADGSLLLTVGDGFDYREDAQKLSSHLGKIIRVMPDGSIPGNNPFVDTADALPEIWSYGHRNMQGIAITDQGTVFAHEHGPQGGDEVNIIKPGLNYGWPAITQGIDYNGAGISPYTEYEGMQQPLVDWTPSIAPAGLSYYDGSQFPEWKGDLFIVSLAQNSVRQVRIKDGNVVFDKRVFPELDMRMRDIRTGPDGALYILTDGSEGKLLRISPK